jgi:hypothetical protein
VEQRNSWEIERLKESVSQVNRKQEDQEVRLRALESFRDATLEKLIVIYNKLDELQEGDKWIKRVFISSLITAITGAIVSFILWAIKGG